MIEARVIAYEITSPDGFRLVPAISNREWMSESHARFAERCLPMLIANQAGWFILNNCSFQATWDGSQAIDSVRIEFAAEPTDMVASHFGHGILTWMLPFLFRTPEGYNLLARGPANMPKDGIQALEGIVETDWTVAPFTMNWKFTRPNHPVEFMAGEPICMLVPQRRGELEAFHPMIRLLEEDPEMDEAYRNWHHNREDFLQGLREFRQDAVQQGWQKDYFQGRHVDGSQFPAHQTRLKLREFESFLEQASDSGEDPDYDSR